MDIGGGFAPATAYLDALSIIHLRLAVITGLDNTEATVMPVGLRPPYAVAFTAIDGGGAFCHCVILPNGNVTLLDGPTSDIENNGFAVECSFSAIA